MLKPRPLPSLLLLGFVLAFCVTCSRFFRFTQPLLNDIFLDVVLFFPFLAISPLLKLPRIPKVLGRILTAPFLLISLDLMLYSVACETGNSVANDKDGCIFHLGVAKQDGYSVDLIRDNCGGVLSSSIVRREQRKPLLPGFYVFRTIDLFDEAYEGSIETIGTNQVRVQIPNAVDLRSLRTGKSERVYTLKRHLFF